MSDWERPKYVPYPSIWRTFQRKDDTGVEKEFWIQDLTDEYKEDFLNIVTKGFMTDESICKSLNLRPGNVSWHTGPIVVRYATDWYKTGLEAPTFRLYLKLK